MKTKLTKIHYYKWSGDPVEAENEFKHDNRIKVDFEGSKLLLKTSNATLPITRGLNVVAILVPKPPHNIGWNYYRMNDKQLDQYQKYANRGGHIVLA